MKVNICNELLTVTFQLLQKLVAIKISLDVMYALIYKLDKNLPSHTENQDSTIYTIVQVQIQPCVRRFMWFKSWTMVCFINTIKCISQ